MTLQIYDSIIVDDLGWILGGQPLCLWLAAHPDVAESFARCPYRNTANNRGYVAIWLVQDEKLYLRELQSPAVQSFERLEERLPLFAGWVYGKMAILQHSGVSGRDGLFSYLSIEGGRVEFDGKGSIPVTVRRGSNLFIDSAPDPEQSGSDGAAQRQLITPGFFPRGGDLRPWPDSYIAPELRTYGSGVWNQTLDDSTDRWGLHAALMAAGLWVWGQGWK